MTEQEAAEEFFAAMHMRAEERELEHIADPTLRMTLAAMADLALWSQRAFISIRMSYDENNQAINIGPDAFMPIGEDNGNS